MGRPTGLKIVSIQDTVTLSWNSIDLDDLTGFQVYRKSEMQSDFVPIHLNPSDENAFQDSDIDFGIEYSYQVSAVGIGFESARSDSVTVEPGPTFTWVGDNSTRGIFKLTHDSRHRILSVGQFATITDLESNPKTGEVWLIERISLVNGNVRKISPEGRVQEIVVRFTAPEDGAMDAVTGAFWIADSRNGLVVKLDSTGNQMFSLTEFSNPVALSVDQRNGGCWLANQETNEVVKVSSDGMEIDYSHVELSALQTLVVNSSDGSVWISDSSRVLKVDENGDPVLEISETFEFVSVLAVDDLTGDLWIIDRGPSTVSKFTQSGTRDFEINGFFLPSDLSINLFDNSCLVADPGNQRLVRLSPNGETLHVFDGLRFPEVLAVQNEPLIESRNTSEN
ncbi:hypothetical protein GWN42_24265 [candidate division KSB1 bacterium]|nr:hypothetical protein [candidate division KSB1 bacterium]NIV95819.1 hypothetical protein [candidate division KSB1 bacterium]